MYCINILRIIPKKPSYNRFSKVLQYKINMQKSIAFLYSDNEQVETKIEKCNTIYNFSKENEILMYKTNKTCRICMMKVTKCY